MNYRHRRDGQTTIYEICVVSEDRGQGVGRSLIDALQEEAREQGKSFMQLKAMTWIRANGFYEHLGFTRVAVVPGRRQPLGIWRLQSSQGIQDTTA